MSAAPVFAFHRGDTPLLISVPHDGRLLPDDIEATMTPAARGLPDTDWHVAELYGFVRELGASLLTANYSRYVVDLNRPDTDGALYEGQVSTGLCPLETFAGEPIYAHGSGMDDDARAQRIDRYWRPYHEQVSATLSELAARHGYALLWDAHSIASSVPRLFDGRLPALNLGSNGGKSCPAAVEQAVVAVARQSPFSSVVNGRFTGGYITRRYGEPGRRRYALQLEIAQRCYMDERTLRYDRERARRLRVTLKAMLSAYLHAARRHNGDIE